VFNHKTLLTNLKFFFSTNQISFGIEEGKQVMEVSEAGVSFCGFSWDYSFTNIPELIVWSTR
jgi:hypothetical protein